MHSLNIKNIGEFCNIRHIIGPNKLQILNINNKLVLLFSDIHREIQDYCLEKENSITILDFLEILFAQSNRKIDYFQEAIYFNMPTKYMKNNNIMEKYMDYSANDNKYINKINKKYHDCISNKENKCLVDYPNVRFHNIEFRRYFSYNLYNFIAKEHSFYKFVERYIIKIGYDHKVIEFLNRIDDYKIILKYILDGDLINLSILLIDMFGPFATNEYIRWFQYPILNQYSHYYRVSKQINSLSSNLQRIFKKEIFDLYDSKIAHLINRIKKIYKNLSFNINSITINMKELENLQKSISFLTKEFSIIIMDAYASSRMLKTILNYKDSDILLVHAGAFHIENYYKILISVSNVDQNNTKLNPTDDPVELYNNYTINFINNKAGCVDLDPKKWHFICSEL